MAPFQAGGGNPGQMGMPSVQSFMEGQGFRSAPDGSFTQRRQQGGPSWAPGGGIQRVMPGAAAQRHNAAYSMGDQGNAAAQSDFNSLRDIVNSENVQRADLRGRMADGYGAARADGDAAARMELQDGYADAASLEGQAGGDYETFAKFRDQNLEFQKDAYGNLIDKNDKITGELEKGYIDDISAAHAGTMQGAQAQIQQVENDARMQGLSPEATAAQVANIRESALRQGQSVVAPMMAQKRSLMAQVKTQLAGVQQGALGNLGQQMSAAGGQTVSALQTKSQMSTAATTARAAARANSFARKMQGDQLALAYGQQEASVLQNLGQRYPSAYDSFLQSAYSYRSFGRRNRIGGQ